MWVYESNVYKVEKQGRRMGKYNVSRRDFLKCSLKSIVAMGLSSLIGGCAVSSNLSLDKNCRIIRTKIEHFEYEGKDGKEVTVSYFKKKFFCKLSNFARIYDFNGDGSIDYIRVFEESLFRYESKEKNFYKPYSNINLRLVGATLEGEIKPFNEENKQEIDFYQNLFNEALEKIQKDMQNKTLGI